MVHSPPPGDPQWQELRSSFTFRDKNLNELLLAGPNLGASLLGVLLRFREHSIAISSDIKGMFHQVRLLLEDRPLLRFLWRDLQASNQGCTIGRFFHLGRHVLQVLLHTLYRGTYMITVSSGDAVRESIKTHFYVDNWRQSFSSPDMAKEIVDKMRELFKAAGFELRQWASNTPEVSNQQQPTYARRSTVKQFH